MLTADVAGVAWPSRVVRFLQDQTGVVHGVRLVAGDHLADLRLVLRAQCEHPCTVRVTGSKWIVVILDFDKQRFVAQCGPVDASSSDPQPHQWHRLGRAPALQPAKREIYATVIYVSRDGAEPIGQVVFLWMSPYPGDWL